MEIFYSRTKNKVLPRAGEPGVFGSLEAEPLEKKKQEPEPCLEKKSALLEDKTHKEIVLILLFLR